MAARNPVGFTTLLVLGAITAGHGQTIPATPELSRREAVVLMRRVNTAQAREHAQGGQYRTLASVIQHDPTLQPQLSVTDEQTALVKDYKLTLIRSEDGRRYQAALTSDKTCALALFTNEQGPIYLGRVLDCPAE